MVQQIAGRCNRIVNESVPVADARLSDGSRVSLVLPPVALNGPVITIRRFPKNPIHMDRLVELGAVTTEAAAFLRALVRSGYNIFISGGTGSGKTTFLNALSDFIPKEERIITIEDNAELQIQGAENLVRLEARQANTEGKNSVDDPGSHQGKFTNEAGPDRGGRSPGRGGPGYDSEHEYGP